MEVIKEFVAELRRDGFDIDVDEFFQNLPDKPYLESPRKRKSRKKKPESDSEDTDSDDDKPIGKAIKRVRIKEEVPLKAQPVSQAVAQAVTQHAAAFDARVTRSTAAKRTRQLVCLSSDDDSIDGTASSPTPTKIQKPPLSPKFISILKPNIIVPTTNTQPIQTLPPPEQEKERKQYSDALTLSIPKELRTAKSSPPNNSETEQAFLEVVQEKLSDIPEEVQNKPSPTHSNSPPPLYVANPPLNPFPINIAHPIEIRRNTDSLSKFSSVKTKDFDYSTPEGDDQTEEEEDNSEHTTMAMDDTAANPASETRATSEANSSNFGPPAVVQLNNQIIPYPYPQPFNLLGYVSTFSEQASTWVKNLYATSATSEQEAVVRAQWDAFLAWFHNKVDDMGFLYEDEREAAVESAKARWANRLARIKRQQAQKESALRQKLFDAMSAAEEKKRREEEEEQRKLEEAEAAEAEAAKKQAEAAEAERIEALERVAKLEAEAAALKAKVLGTTSDPHASGAESSEPPVLQAEVAVQPGLHSAFESIAKRFEAQEQFNRKVEDTLTQILQRLQNQNP